MITRQDLDRREWLRAELRRHQNLLAHELGDAVAAYFQRHDEALCKIAERLPAAFGQELQSLRFNGLNAMRSNIGTCLHSAIASANLVPELRSELAEIEARLGLLPDPQLPRQVYVKRFPVGSRVMVGPRRGTVTSTLGTPYQGFGYKVLFDEPEPDDEAQSLIFNEDELQHLFGEPRP